MPDRPALRLEHFLPNRLSILSQTTSADLHRRYFGPSHLSVPQWRVIAVLGRFAPLSASDICQRTVMDKVTVSRAVAGLRRRRLVEQATDGADRRRSQLRLTQAGRAMHDLVVPLALGYEAELLAQLSPAERKALDGLLDRLLEAARTVAARPEP